jgi:hypothetical protein
MQFQSPVSLRLLPTLPAPQQLKGPLPTGSQTDRAGGREAAAKSNAAPGSKTHRVMVSTNASSLAAVKQASERNRSLFDKISASVSNISAALRADSVRGADAAEAANAAQDLHDVVKGIIHTPAIQQIQTTSRTTGSTASGKAQPLHSSAHAPARGGRGAVAQLPSSQKAAAAALEPETSSANPLIEQIERLMLACSVNSNEQPPPRRGQHKGKSVSKDTKAGADCSRAAAADAVERGVLRVKHVPLGCVCVCRSFLSPWRLLFVLGVTLPRFTDKKLRALFAKFGHILSIKLESKFGVVKVRVPQTTRRFGLSTVRTAAAPRVNVVAGSGTDVQRRGQREGGSKRHERVRYMPLANFGSVLVEEGMAESSLCAAACVADRGCSNRFDVI